MKILKITLLSLFVFVLLEGSSEAKNISNNITGISIEGLFNVKQKAILKKLKSKAGKSYSEEAIKSDLARINDMEYFEKADVSVDTSTYKIYFKVKEKPLLKKITIKGNKKISTSTLKQEISIKEKEFYDIGEQEKSKDRILTLYSDKGYPDCKVEMVQLLDDRTNQLNMTILIKEGNRILIEKVEVAGVKAFKPKKVLKQMENTRRKKVFKLESLNKDLDKITEFYKNNGYIQVELGEPVIEYDKERTKMYIKIPVKEGVKFKVGDISFSGNTVYTEKELKKGLLLIKGKLYKEEDYREFHQSVVDLYADKGYLNARVMPKFDADEKNGIMNVQMDITENDIVYLGKVYIDGLISTKEFVIRRELILKEGDVFAASKIRRSIEKIHNLGFIDNVEPEILPTPKPDVMDLDFNITEGKPGMLSAGAGYSSIDQLVGTLQLSHLNLLGRAQRLNLMWEFGARKQNYQISWTEPWFLGKPTSLGLSLFNTDRLVDYASISSAYHDARKGASVTLGPRLSDYLSLSFGYSYQEIRIYDVEIPTSTYTDPTIIPIVDTHDISSIVSGAVVYDSRDSIFDATHGTVQSLSVSLAGGPLGGNINYIKPVMKNSIFIPTFWKFVLSFNATFGMINSFGNSPDVPTYERFYIGGSESVRGYKYRTEIGPINGGKAMSVFNAEYKFPLVQEKRRSVLVGAFFFDAGGSWENPGDFTLEIGNKDNQMKCGAGFGIRFTSPVFPLRLDWGYGFNHKPGEDLQQIYFTIGNIF